MSDSLRSNSNRALPRIEWTPDLAARFWRDLESSEFLNRIAFAQFAAPFLIGMTRPYVVEGAKVLDYGAGAYLFLVKELLKQGFDASYFEPNSGGQGSGESEGLNNRRISALPKSEYDCVFFSEVIEHLTDSEIDAALGGIATTLKPDGILVVTTPDAEDLLTASRYCPTCRHLFHPWGHVRSFTADALESILAKHGFSCSELHSVDFSSNRELLEESRRFRLLLGEVIGEVDRLLGARRTGLDSQTFEALREQFAKLQPYAMTEADSDPLRRNIGAGGTLVAIARRSDT